MDPETHKQGSEDNVVVLLPSHEHRTRSYVSIHEKRKHSHGSTVTTNTYTAVTWDITRHSLNKGAFNEVNYKGHCQVTSFNSPF